MLKKFVLLSALIAVFAVAGCGSDEPAKKAPANAPQAATVKEISPSELPSGFKRNKDAVKIELHPDGTIVETEKDGFTVTTTPDGKRTYKSGNSVKLGKSDGKGIHHFSDGK